jgi:LysM repeat protein
MWTKSACVVLAWGSILVIVVAAGMNRPARPAQANIRTASTTNEVTGSGVVSVAAVLVVAARPVSGYVVQPGDTLSGIAARLAVRGGWPALYAANRRVIGPDPALIRPGTVLVLPGDRALARYTVAAGDTLAAIAAGLAVPGGWPVLYAANRRVIGGDPGLIRPGMVLVIPRPAAPRVPRLRPGHRPNPAPPPPGSHHPQPQRTAAPAAAGMPSWLKIMLVAGGIVIGAAFLAEAMLLIRRRRRRATAVPRPGQTRQPVLVPPQVPRLGRGSGGSLTRTTEVVLADYDRVVVTYSRGDDTVYVLRPPGENPAAILRAARLALPEGPYRELAGRLGLPDSWPIVVADYHRLVVTCSPSDGMVCVLRPPGQDPAAVLRAARLVLSEEPYEELADHLGVPPDLPMG